MLCTYTYQHTHTCMRLQSTGYTYIHICMYTSIYVRKPTRGLYKAATWGYSYRPSRSWAASKLPQASAKWIFCKFTTGFVHQCPSMVVPINHPNWWPLSLWYSTSNYHISEWYTTYGQSQWGSVADGDYLPSCQSIAKCLQKTLSDQLPVPISLLWW